MAKPELDVIIPVHNGRFTIVRTILGLLRQNGLDGFGSKIIVVDDGSTDGTAEIVTALKDPRIQLIRLAQCGGRARACNQGLAASTAGSVLFFDADCLPLDDNLVQGHLTALSNGFDLSFGSITSTTPGFWGDYARLVEDQRTGRALAGDFLALTSCNLAVRRTAIDKVGGFYPDYRYYGFEDRDLIASLLTTGVASCYSSNIAVDHAGDVSVAQLCRKMRTAGRHTSGVFFGRYPDIYRAMSFSQVDARTATPLVSYLAAPWSAAALPAQWLADVAVRLAWLPMRVQVAMVRFATGLAYLRGTSQAVKGAAGEIDY